jgi:hypothetical protein
LQPNRNAHTRSGACPWGRAPSVRGLTTSASAQVIESSCSDAWKSVGRGDVELNITALDGPTGKHVDGELRSDYWCFVCNALRREATRALERGRHGKKTNHTPIGPTAGRSSRSARARLSSAQHSSAQACPRSGCGARAHGAAFTASIARARARLLRARSLQDPVPWSGWEDATQDVGRWTYWTGRAVALSRTIRRRRLRT